METIVTLFTKGFKSKTVWFGYALLIMSWLQDHSDAAALIFKDHTQAALAFIGLAVVILRSMTSQPLGDK
jgi:hypothetical protein